MELQGKNVCRIWWKFWEVIAFWRVESNPVACCSSQRRESVCSVHPLIMNLVLGLTRLGLPCLANLSTLLREDIIVAGGNSVILSRLGKTQRKGKTRPKGILVRVALGKIITGNSWKNIAFQFQNYSKYWMAKYKTPFTGLQVLGTG